MSLPKATTQTAIEEEHKSLKGNGTVLLVEDNPEVASVSIGLFEQLGYNVRWATGASAALVELERDDIDIVFTDIVMPGKMDGIGLAKSIREKNPQIPILLVTGYSRSQNEVSSQFPILRKPYQLHELSRELRKLA
jgi:CheY-like chemotaxis protein